MVAQQGDGETSPQECQEPSFFARYFGRGKTPEPADARPGLRTSVGVDAYGGDSDKFHAAVMEQYKVYVEMADRVSSRRALANTFFITLNSAIFTVIGVLWRDQPAISRWWVIFPTIVLVGQCLAWFWLLRSYRQLNSGKYAVVGALEELLPTSPYWGAEWHALGKGEDKSRYWPLTHLEQWLPMLFLAAYLSGAIAVIVTAP